MTGMLFSEPNRRKPYRPKGYRSKLALDNTDTTEEGLVGGEFDGDLTNDPLEDMEDHQWAVEPGSEEVVNQDEEFEREENTLSNTASSRRVANTLDDVNPTGTVFTDYTPGDRAGVELGPNMTTYSETAGVGPDDRVMVYRGVPPGVQSELADGDFITDIEQLAKDYAGAGEVISQEVFADEILDDRTEPLGNEYLFRPRKTSKRAFHRRVAEDYFMEHRPAGPDFGSPLHDLNDMFPDIYTSPQYYDFGEEGNKDSFETITRSQGKPDEMVTMYRSIPPDGNVSFSPGDWVSTSGDYARQHSLSEREEDDDFIVMEQQVPASSLWSEGNSVAEWGYHGDALDGVISDKFTPKRTLDRFSSRKRSDKFQDDKYKPGTLYRGLSVDLLSEEEAESLRDWSMSNEFDPEYPEGFSMAEPNYEMIYPILDRLEENGGLGRHWTKDYDVANEFSRGWANDDPGNQGVVLRIDWDGEGIDTDYDEATTIADGSTVGVYEEEKEVNLAPGAGANLVGIDFTNTWGDRSSIPVPDVPIYASKRGSRRVAVDSETSSPQTLYRGLRMNLDPEDEDRIRQTMERGVAGQSLEDIGQELTVGPELLDRMEEYGGMGTHWSTRPEIAERFSLQSGGDGGGIPVMLTTEWDGSGQDHDRTGVGGEWADEGEVTLLPGTPVSVNSVTFGSSFGDGHEVLNTDKYDRYTDQFTSQGLQPPKGGPQSRFANKSAGTEDRPGNIYRGLSSDFLSDDEYNQIVDWSRDNEFDPDNFTMAEPNYEMIYPILERLEEEQGLGRHWSTDHGVANDFATQGAWNSDYDPDDPDSKEHFGIVFRGDWGGEGVDYAEQHRGYDGVMRPSNLPHEKEVTLHPGSEVNLLGMEIFEPGGFRYEIPVPDIPIYSKKRVSTRKREKMNAINSYLRFAKARGMNPNGSETPRLYRRASRNLSPASMVEISRWRKAQNVANKTAQQVLTNTRSYRRKMSSSSWYLDNKLGAYVSKTQKKFACSCGSSLEVPAYNMCKCGKVWNAYKVSSATKGDTMFVVREVPVRENVLIANKTASRRRKKASPSPQDILNQFPDWQITDDREDTWQVDSPDFSDALVREPDGTFTWTTDSESEYEMWSNTPSLDEALEEIDAAVFERRHRSASRSRRAHRSRRSRR